MPSSGGRDRWLDSLTAEAEYVSSGRQLRSLSTVQKAWKTILQGARVVFDSNRQRMYQKMGDYEHAKRDFFALKPSYVRHTETQYEDELIGRVGEFDVYLRGRSKADEKNFDALLVIVGRREATILGQTSPYRITRGIKYVNDALPTLH